MKKVISIIIILALVFGISTIAMANDAEENKTTEGSIEFRNGGVTIIPPDEDCCHCVGQSPCPGGCDDKDDPHPDGQPCECPCHDAIDKYKNFDLGGDLYFGSWIIGAYGRFISNNIAQTTARGTHTGLTVINRTPAGAEMRVEISDFYYPGHTVENPKIIAGAELTMMAIDNTPNLPIPGGASLEQLSNVMLEPYEAATPILRVPSGFAVRASWFGDLDILPGRAIHLGEAKATLTWTSMNVPGN